MPQESPQQTRWRKEFEELGETQVRMMFGRGNAVEASDKEMFSRVWLHEKDSAKRDAREEETLSIARRANRIAWIAAAIAAASIIKDIAMYALSKT